MEVSRAALPAAAASDQVQWRALAAGTGAEAGFRVGGKAGGLDSPDGAGGLEYSGEAGEGGTGELGAGCPGHWAPAHAEAPAAPLCAAMDVDEARLSLCAAEADAAGAGAGPRAAPGVWPAPSPGRGTGPERSPATAPGADRGGRFMVELAAAMAARRDERGAAGGRSPLALALEARPRKRVQARLCPGVWFGFTVCSFVESAPLFERRFGLSPGMSGRLCHELAGYVSQICIGFQAWSRHQAAAMHPGFALAGAAGLPASAKLHASCDTSIRPFPFSTLSQNCRHGLAQRALICEAEMCKSAIGSAWAGALGLHA